MANPEWITMQNNRGLSPFHILSRSGRIDERTMTALARIGGPNVFRAIDLTGNTAIHSAMREDTDLPTLRYLIQALPDSLKLRTVYGDSPLHLACYRRAHPDVVREIAVASSLHQHCPILEPNASGQTPLGIAMEEFCTVVGCRRGRWACCVTSEFSPEQSRVFDIVAVLVKILYYGPNCPDHNCLNLVRACVAFDCHELALDPVFIQRAIHIRSDDVRMMDDKGTLPIHIEASIPVEKMLLLDGCGGCCGGECQKRSGILRTLLKIYPASAAVPNMSGDFPLNLMIENGRMWGNEIAVALQAFPPALHLQKGLVNGVLANILEKVTKECDINTLFSILVSRPDFFLQGKSNES